jgi:hypothetical protein
MLPCQLSLVLLDGLKYPAETHAHHSVSTLLLADGKVKKHSL